jgi:hypothetical protein
MRFYGKTARLERQPHGGTIISAVIDCAAASPKALRRAFARADRVQLDQMARKDLPAGGVILDASVDDNGRVGLRALITDPTAAAKALHAVYSGLLVELDGDEIDGISLIDAPSDFVTKASGGAQVIAKIFTRKGVSKVEPVPVYTKKYLRLMRQQAVQEVLRKATPALPPAMEAALRERQRAEDMFKASPSIETKAVFARAHNLVVLEQIKCGRPIVGDPRFSLGR